MSIFLTTAGISYQIEQLLLAAKEKVVLVSPYLQISRTLSERLGDVAARGVPLIIVYGKSALHAHGLTRLRELGTLRLYFCEHLHAKCYVNEESAIVTSMNMYEYSERNNREMGILLERRRNRQPYIDVRQEIESILRASTEDAVTAQRAAAVAEAKATEQRLQLSQRKEAEAKRAASRHPPSQRLQPQRPGSCVRCRDGVSHDINAPLCWPCYRTWSSFSNVDFPERFCHTCGEQSHGISYANAECARCRRSADRAVRIKRPRYNASL